MCLFWGGRVTLRKNTSTCRWQGRGCWGEIKPCVQAQCPVDTIAELGVGGGDSLLVVGVAPGGLWSKLSKSSTAGVSGAGRLLSVVAGPGVPSTTIISSSSSAVFFFFLGGVTTFLDKGLASSSEVLSDNLC